MTRLVAPGPRSGSVKIPASKSQAHRLLICAALGTGETELLCDGVSRDIAATIACLNALGAAICTQGERLRVRPIRAVPEGECLLPCGESGSTLRFLLPVVGALGAKAVFRREGRLPERPLSPLDTQLASHGMTITADGALLRCGGQLTAGDYALPGNVSSQYISGLLLALPRLPGKSRLTVTGPLESAAYVTMTEEAQRLAGITISKHNMVYVIEGQQRGSLPPVLPVEGDWSNAAFFLVMGALSPNGVCVRGMDLGSAQGDRAVLDILRAFGALVEEREDGILVRRAALRGVTIDAAPIPDLIPVLSVLAAAAEGETRIENAGRLRLKESDRLASTTAMLRALGAEIEERPAGLVIRGKSRLAGGMAQSAGDHRIAMAAAAAASVCEGPVTICGAECVAKSYPRFWEDLEQLSGGEA